MIDNTSTASLVANRYRLLEQLGAGGMGTVYRAYDRLTGEVIALKRVDTSLSALDFDSRNTVDTDDPRLGLAHEFETLASLRHPHVIRVKDYGFSRDHPAFFTMTLLENAQTILEAAEGLPLGEQVGLVIQALQALDYIHWRGLLHRDLKPSNILVVDGHVYVVDFGLAVQRSGNETGEIAGTIAYMPPEVLGGQSPTEASDLYSLGVIMYELFAGESPYDEGDVNTLINGILRQAVDLSRLDVPEAMRGVIGRLLSKDPTDRIIRANETITALCDSVGLPVPPETTEIRDSFLETAAFIGRKEEMTQLNQAVTRLRRERKGAAWLVGGESGVGKSRLLHELATRAMVNGTLVLRGQAVAEGGVTYQIWRDVLRRAALLVEFSIDEASLFKHIVPDAENLLGYAIPNLEETGTENFQKRLSLLIDNMFRQVTQQYPTLLILEDLQWIVDSDRDLKLLRDLAHITENIPLVIMGSYRNDEVPDMAEYVPGVEIMRLNRLNSDEITSLSVSMLGQAGERPQVLDLLHKETEGNVFFLVEVVRMLAEDAGRIGDIGKRTLPEQIIAGGVQRVVEYRLRQVPDEARAMLEVAAVAGRLIDLDIIQAVAPDFDVEHWLNTCTNAAVLDVQEGRYRFTHDKLREAILDSLTESRRIACHQMVAAAIEQVYADSLDDYATVLAGHYAAIGDTEREGDYVVRAARIANESSAYREAQRHYRRALTLRTYERAEDPQHAQADLLLGVGMTSYSLSEYEVATEHCEKAHALYEAVGDEHGQAMAIKCQGECLFRQGWYEPARPYIDQALAIFRRLENPRDIGYSLMDLGVIEAQTGNPETARSLFQECHTFMVQTGDQLAIARALNNLGVIHDVLGEIDAAYGFYSESLAIRRTINDMQGIAYSLSNMAQIMRNQGNADAAREALEESLKAIRMVGEKRALAQITSTLSRVYRDMGNLAEAERHERDALIIRRRIGDLEGVAMSFTGLAEIAIDRGDLEAAWGFLRQGLQAAREIDNEPQMVQIMATVGDVLRRSGEVLEAVRVLSMLQPFSERLQQSTQGVQNTLDVLRDVLPEADFDAAQREGQALDLREVVTRYSRR